MVLFSYQESASIVRRDYPNPFKEDIEASYLMLNLWHFIMSENPHYREYEFKLCVSTGGISATIAAAQDTAMTLLTQGASGALTPCFGRLVAYADSYENERLVLQQLRFPKRFAFRQTDQLRKRALQDFLATNNKIKLYERKELSPMLTSMLSDVARSVLGQKNSRKMDKITYLSTPNLTKLPSGAAAGCSKTTAGKLSYIFKKIPRPTGSLPVPDGFFPFWEASSNYCDVTVVPKSYKAARVIAEEEPHRQLLLGEIGDLITDSLHNARGKYGSKGHVCLTDQSINASLARRGSIDGSLATIDCHAASDSISYRVAAAVLPPKTFKNLLEIIAETMVVDGKTRTKFVYQTMGSRLTFPLETLFFWSVCMVAKDFCALAGCRTSLSDYAVYGDDIICPTPVARTVIDLLNIFGFQVNEEKSFFSEDNHFRESCGEDYRDGYLLSSKYWFRGPLEPGDAGLHQLVALQHRLVGYPEANYFLTSYILKRRPTMTMSQIGSEYDDIWSSFPVVSRKGEYEFHTCFDSVQPNKQLKRREKEIIDCYLYYLYLKDGPSYDDPLMELLGVSSDRRRAVVIGEFSEFAFERGFRAL